MSDHTSWIFRLSERLHIVIALLAALLLTVILAVAVGSGDTAKVVVVMMVLGGVALVLMLGDKYWMLLPFAFASGLPAIPIQGRFLELPEIATVFCSVAFLVRLAVKRQKLTFFSKQHAPFLLYAGWVAFIFFLHPVGLSAFSGSTSGLGGARFYAKIFLALIAFIIMANQELSEKDCKAIVIMALVGGCLESAYSIAVYFVPMLGEQANVQLAADPDDFYSWQQGLAGVPMLLLGFGFARYRASELFSMNKLWAVIGFGLCVVLIAMSGKRGALASIPMFAVIAAFLRREWGYLMFWLGGALLAGTIIVLGHGELFRFPLTVQRAFSILPAQWDAELGEDFAGGKDAFRAELRRLALKKIAEDPWIGTGYQVDLSVADALQVQRITVGGDMELQVMPFALGSSWHNTWLGYAADFGIPLSVITALIYFAVIRSSYRLAVRFPPGSMRATLAAYFFLTATIRLLRSHTSGHSADDTFGHWWSYGVLVALGIAYAKSAASPAPSGALSPLEPSPPAGATRPPAPSLSGSRPAGARAGTFAPGSSRR